MLGASSVDLFPGWWIAVVKQTELPLRGYPLVGVGRSHLNVREAAGVELVPASPQICQRVLPTLNTPHESQTQRWADALGRSSGGNRLLEYRGLQCLLSNAQARRPDLEDQLQLTHRPLSMEVKDA